MVVQARTSPTTVQPEKAWAAYVPDSDRPWSLPLAAHLYRRAAFGANQIQLDRAVAEGPQRTVDRLVRPEADTAAFNRMFDDYEASISDSDGEPQLRGWWLRRIIETPHPLLEKMTLFWHGHVATGGAAVKNAGLMRTHVRLLRAQALGNLRLLLQALLRDPATLLGHGAGRNHRTEPNENFVRHLMERITLGPGRCTDRDLQEAARACTGSFVMNNRYRHIAREHDGGAKQILGQSGTFTDEDVLRILLEQPATAEHLVRQLYRWLISESEPPTDSLIAPLARSFAADHDIGRLVETMLRSNLFFSDMAYRQKIKSPVEFAVGIVIALDGMVSTTELSRGLANLGQRLLRPPTAGGWAGGRHWINEVTLVRRHNLALELLRGSGRFGDGLDPRTVAREHRQEQLDDGARFLVGLFLQDDVESAVAEALRAVKPEPTLRRYAHSIVTLPEFQLA